MTGPRPVTPVGIAAALLEDVAAELGEVVHEDVRADLERARALVGGLDGYLADQTSPPSPDLALLSAMTDEHPWPDDSPLEREMLSGHVEGQLLRLLVQLSGARRVLDVGTFTGYSALAMAEALPPDGRVIACEVDPDVAAIARAAFDRAAAGDLVRLEVGPAGATLDRLADEGEVVDLAFVDADKPGYEGYLTTLLDRGLLGPGGLLVADNTLFQGEPWLADAPSANGAAIHRFNRALADDPRVEQVVVPLRDGVTLARVRDDG